jgi:uncharacterized protein (UPF0332 family)
MWDKAAKDLKTAQYLLKVDSERAHECAYDAIFKAVYAIFRCMGFRIAPTNQRVTGVELLKAVLDDPAHEELTEAFDEMRDKRNNVSYEAAAATETEAKNAIEDAEEILKLLEPTFKTMEARYPQ